MTDKEKKNQIADILLDFYDEYDSNVINRPMIPNIYAGKILDSLKEKPVSIWHDANQQPEINTPILVRTYDNIVESTKRYNDNLIPWEDRIKRDNITHWCYVEDLLKL